jgi:hypothetical protein
MYFLGYTDNPQVSLDVVVASSKVQIGSAFEWRCRITTQAKQKLAFTLRLFFLKANGSQSAKVFAIKDGTFESGEVLELSKRQTFRPMTTRVLYPGTHRAELLVNRKVLAKRQFELVE